MVAQPALSRRLRELEEELGKPLFLRSGRQLQITPFGNEVLQHARTVLAELDLIERLRISNSNEMRVLRVGASLTTLSRFVPLVISRFRNMEPNVDIVVQTGVSQEIFDMVADGRVELGVVSAASQHRFIVRRFLFRDSLWAVCPADHPLSELREVNPKHLHDVPLVTMTSRTVLRQDLNAVFSTYGVKPRICMEIDNVDAIQRMVEAHLGVSLLPKSVLSPAIESYKIKAVPFVVDEARMGDSLFRQYSVIHLDAPLSEDAERWMAVCMDVARQFAAE